MEFRSLLAMLTLPVSARLGAPAANESSRFNVSELNTSFVEFSSSRISGVDASSQAKQSQAGAAFADNLSKAEAELSKLNTSFLEFSASGTTWGGYQHLATSTVYGDSTKAACGGLDTWELVKGTPYYNVASAQSMWRNCGNHANCWCGASGGGSGTHGMGCFKCAKGRFLHSRYGKAFGGFASEEIVVVVGDLCPHLGNQKWCPEKAGQRNDYGSLNHLDFSHPPAGIHNNDFVFTPISCPDDLRARYDQLSQCGR
eukprot:TRINITY_DN3839_c0_g1_i1.p1 TRINITY_DN3839_c0_g1~~TRINITY_DN3839_c0_g1_i1.p1  ORF type:complete len:257 (+),score=36.03 TRINITY_DN3839_c0_g1_i1:51-821(+)